MRALDPVFTVDGIPMLTPDGAVEISWQDLDSDAAGRDESGFLHRAVLRRGVRTWGFTYGVLTSGERAYLQSLFEGKDTFTFTSDEGTCTAYCARGEVRLWNRTKGVYKGMKFNIIEC